MKARRIKFAKVECELTEFDPNTVRVFLLMAYKIELPREMFKALWRLREFCGEGPIIRQVREGVAEYLQRKEKEIGCPIKDISEARERHKYEQGGSPSQPETLQEAKG